MASNVKKEIENIELDLSELSSLEVMAKRQDVKTLLAIEVNRLTQKRNQLLKQMPIELKSETPVTAATGGPTVVPTAGGQPAMGSVVVTNYMWDQNEDYIKVYIEIEKNYCLDSKQIEISFKSKRSFAIIFGKFRFTLSQLNGDIDANNSHHKLTKSGKLVISLKKAVKKHWNSINESETKFKSDFGEEKEDNNAADPSAGLMKLMKQMYTEGDDDMKRTIAKSWYESQQKQKTGDFGQNSDQLLDI